MLTHVIPPAFRGGVHLSIPSTTIGSEFRVYQATPLRTDDVYCGEAAGTGPVVLKLVPVTGAALAGITMNLFEFIDYNMPGEVYSNAYQLPGES